MTCILDLVNTLDSYCSLSKVKCNGGKKNFHMLLNESALWQLLWNWPRASVIGTSSYILLLNKSPSHWHLYFSFFKLKLIRTCILQNKCHLYTLGVMNKKFQTKTPWRWGNFNFCMWTGPILMLTVPSPLQAFMGNLKRGWLECRKKIVLNFSCREIEIFEMFLVCWQHIVWELVAQCYISIVQYLFLVEWNIVLLMP